MKKNSFLNQLLTLQQDGQGAISGPVNWISPPLLQVRTELHDTVESLVASFLDASNLVARWHFFVGSPGNGKSAGAGMLVQQLIEAKHSVIDSVTKCAIGELDKSRVPYRLDVRRKDEKHAYLYIAQDASVLPDPYATNADPASALIELLREASSRGVALVVCTNRGVIERAYAAALAMKDASHSTWFKALKVAVGTGGSTEPISLVKGAAKQVFSSIRVSHTSLDRRSLVLGTHTLDRLIKRAVAAVGWDECSDCTSKTLCPFYANKIWLEDDSLRGNVIRLFRHAELIEGQIIVLREALALISLILAGCPHDYSESSPCEWVHGLVQKGDVFSLMSRRIYMVLFSSHAPLALADFHADLKEQQRDFAQLVRMGGGTSDATRRAIAPLLSGKRSPSTDVGAPRLLSRGGTFAQLDVFADSLDPTFADRWSESSDFLLSSASWTCALESAAMVCWADLRNSAANSEDQAPTVYRWLVRWITAYTYRLGALVEGATSFGKDLDVLSEVLQIRGRPNAQQAVILSSIERTLDASLTSMDEGLPLSPTTTLHGDWVKQELRPKFADFEPGAITVVLKFGSTGRTKISLNTRAFIWLKRRAERRIDSATFPREYLETARDAILRVAVTSSYDTKDEVVLRVDCGEDGILEVRRAHGGVYVNE